MDRQRRLFLESSAGSAALAGLSMLLGKERVAGAVPARPGATGDYRIPGRAKRLIYLFQSGAPSQMDLFDYKPGLLARAGTDLPPSVRMGQRLTAMSATQASFPVVPPGFAFAQHGQSGAWLSELLPHTAKVADRICFVKSMFTEQINHDPGITMCQTGSQIAGRPSLGAWLSYGLGSENENLPTFVAMISTGVGDQPLYDRLWGSGFLPSSYQGVRFRSSGDPVLYLNNPPGISRAGRRRFLDDLGALNRMKLARAGDPEIATRIAQYEMGFRMQASVPDLADLSKESDSTFDLYGPDARKPGTFAANCLLARRLAERGVRCIQLFHRGWDQHKHLPADIRKQCHDVDQPAAALLVDLERRGLLDDTLVVWGGEFGRTVYCQGQLTKDDFGRDHHPRCYTVWLAGGGVRPGITHGATDDYCYNIVKDPVHVHDLNATILRCLGIDHTKLTFKFQGRNYRLTDVHGKVVTNILA